MISKPQLLVAIFALLLVPSGRSQAEGLPHNWPMAPSEIEQRFATGKFTILETKGAGGGVTGASKVVLQFEDGTKLKAKWKGAPPRKADGWNNSPRKELASYELQRWLFDENDFVVPTSAARCLPFDKYRAIDPTPKANINSAKCVLGVLSVWMDDVTAPKKFYDKKRFQTDVHYAEYLSDFNLLLYVLDHRDGRQGNLLLSTDPADPRVYAVDNGIAFAPFPWNMFVTNWNKLHVPWLRKQTVDRLRNVGDEQLARLSVITELALDGDGIYQVVPPGKNLDPKKGARIRDGRIQFGLKDKEIAKIKERIEELLEDVDKGKIKVR